jgi:hypothetical protein
MSVGVLEDYKLRDLLASESVGRGTGTPKDKDEVIYECRCQVRGSLLLI